MDNNKQLALWLGDNQPQNGLASLIKTHTQKKDDVVVAMSAALPKKKAMGVLLNITNKDELDKVFIEKNQEYLSLVSGTFAGHASSGKFGGATIKISAKGRVTASLIPKVDIVGKVKAAQKGQITAAEAIKALREAGMSDEEILAELTKPVEKDVPGDATIKTEQQPEQGSLPGTEPAQQTNGAELNAEEKAIQADDPEADASANADFAGPDQSLEDEAKAALAGNNPVPE
jgi:hypothetical protein